jgi:hypothetical protein
MKVFNPEITQETLELTYIPDRDVALYCLEGGCEASFSKEGDMDFFQARKEIMEVLKAARLVLKGNIAPFTPKDDLYKAIRALDEKHGNLSIHDHLLKINSGR